MANKIEGTIEFRNNSAASIEQFDRGIKGLTTGVSALQATLIGGGVVAALTSLVSTVKGVGDEFERLSNATSKTGGTINQLKVVGQAFKEQGLSADDATRAMAFLSREIAQGNPLLKELGVTSFNTYDALLQLSDSLTKNASAGANNAAVMELMSRAGMNSLPALIGLRDKVREINTDLGQLGGLWSDFDVAVGKSADNLNDVVGRKFDSLIGRLKLITAGLTVAIATGRLVGGVGGVFVPGNILAGSEKQNVYKMGSITGPGVEVGANRRTPAPASTTPAWSGVNYPQYGYGPQLREVGAGFAPGGFGTFANRAAGYMRMMGQSGDSGVTKELSRTQQAVRAGAEAIGGEFQGMMNRMLSIQTRSGNVLVQLSASIWNAVIGSLTQAAGQGISGFLIDFVSGFIPGMPKRGGGKAAASGAGVELHVHTLESKTLTSAMLNGSFRDAGINIARRQAVA